MIFTHLHWDPHLFHLPLYFSTQSFLIILSPYTLVFQHKSSYLPFVISSYHAECQLQCHGQDKPSNCESSCVCTYDCCRNCFNSLLLYWPTSLFTSNFQLNDNYSEMVMIDRVKLCTLLSSLCQLDTKYLISHKLCSPTLLYP